eukprot:c11156_g1_i1.p1 GENE.c11156_g1_i1~~c11156_g1_i1.p1  ORF type:complete len:192 (-),score=40.85 c11156_g1_i1:591-1166(-)
MTNAIMMTRTTSSVNVASCESSFAKQEKMDMALRVGRYIEALCQIEGPKSPSVFECLTAPPISNFAYSLRLGEHMKCTESAFVIAGVLIRRIFDAQRSIFAELAVLKLYATALVIAVKYIDDAHFSNRYYAECAGVSLSDLNEMEGVFLQLIGYQVYLTTEIYESARVSLCSLDKLLLTIESQGTRALTSA